MRTSLEIFSFISMLLHKSGGGGEAYEKGGLKLVENSFQGRRY